LNKEFWIFFGKMWGGITAIQLLVGGESLWAAINGSRDPVLGWILGEMLFGQISLVLSASFCLLVEIISISIGRFRKPPKLLLIV
jgi:hypothetical protein